MTREHKGARAPIHSSAPLLEGLLRPRESIDRILLSLDAPESGTREPEKARDVLSLVAGGLDARLDAGLALDPVREPRPRLPSLTRREHHALSPDSPMPVCAVRRLPDETQ